MSDVGNVKAKLEAVLRDIGPVAVAVSGGVDSLTLATLAHRTLHGKVEIFHEIGRASCRERVYSSV